MGFRKHGARWRIKKVARLVVLKLFLQRPPTLTPEALIQIALFKTHTSSYKTDYYVTKEKKKSLKFGALLKGPPPHFAKIHSIY